MAEDIASDVDIIMLPLPPNNNPVDYLDPTDSISQNRILDHFINWDLVQKYLLPLQDDN